MTHQIALPPDQEQKLVQQAGLRGLAAEDYLRQIVASGMDGTAALTLGGDALPTLDANALTRERLYADHD